ncbi:MAG TPA: porin family protein [Gammaproteobacteria bacterium]|nr:porin family protein [Gammaproteobacteria bacterium]
MERSLGKRFCSCGLLVSAALAVPGAALAADNGFYLGLASSDVSSDYAVSSFSSSGADDDRGLKAIVGFRPLDSFAIEANYVDMGETTISLPPSTLSIDSQALSVSAVGLIALPLVDLYGRIGVSSWESEASLLGGTQKESGSDPTYGAGAQFRVGSFAFRLEYERFDFEDDSSDLVSIGFTYTFL